ncbi:hypothetical protein [Rossellomorea yichunensis]|uniref:hypothetical protein n=1 Tax=Rossellomorea yichunensis TaxID=3077331 RepID=UPI0028DE6583|nr:hypothetical protein [Rossellomorea sp. YC4-1]MDT9027469.1 hypothetical protein [Rossellomorea sp. YC4-1]
MSKYIQERAKPPHPIIMEVVQTAPNQILLTYDVPTDPVSATNIWNYWIRTNINPPITKGISSEGMDYGLMDTNSLRSDLAVVQPYDNSKMRYTITFRNRAVPGLLHIVLPCYVNVEGSTGYAGTNWNEKSRNYFISY